MPKGLPWDFPEALAPRHALDAADLPAYPQVELEHQHRQHVMLWRAVQA